MLMALHPFTETVRIPVTKQVYRTTLFEVYDKRHKKVRKYDSVCYKEICMYIVVFCRIFLLFSIFFCNFAEKIEKSTKTMLERINHTTLCFMLALLLITQQGWAEKLVFTTAWTAQAEFAGYYVAKEKGFYREVGLDVVIQHPSLTSSTLHRLQSDQCDAAMFSLVSAIDLISQGIPLVNIFQESMNSSNILVSRWCMPPLQMKGKKVGIFQSDPSYMLMIMNKMQHMNYRMVPFSSGINVFLSGAVDATMVVSYNEYIELLQAGFNMPEEYLYRFSEHDYNIQEHGVYVKRAYYNGHRKELSKFAIASQRGWEWAAQHVDEALEIVMKYVTQQKIPTNRIKQRLMLKECLRLQIDRESKQREFRVRADMVEKASRMLKDCGLIKREVSYQELMGHEERR